jgi:hypothetical protein
MGVRLLKWLLSAVTRAGKTTHREFRPKLVSATQPPQRVWFVDAVGFCFYLAERGAICWDFYALQALIRDALAALARAGLVVHLFFDAIAREEPAVVVGRLWFKQMTEIHMSSIDMLKETITAIFNKALSEPNFGKLCADLCRVIVEARGNKTWDFVEVVERDGRFFWTNTAETSKEDKDRLMGPYDSAKEAIDKAAKLTDFKRILLNKCQEEFEKKLTQIGESEKAMADHSAKIAETRPSQDYRAAEQDASNVAESERLTSGLYEKALWSKRKLLGNIQFMGWLYKEEILPDRAMHSIIHRMLVPPNAPAGAIPPKKFLECLVNLLHIIGSTIEPPAKSSDAKNKGLMDGYFTQLQNIADSKSLPTLQRFLVLDLIEMRENKWQARREELKTKKLGDVHKDATHDELDKTRQAVAAPAAPHAGLEASEALGGRSFSNSGRSAEEARPVIVTRATTSVDGVMPFGLRRAMLDAILEAAAAHPGQLTVTVTQDEAERELIRELQRSNLGKDEALILSNDSDVFFCEFVSLAWIAPWLYLASSPPNRFCVSPGKHHRARGGVAPSRREPVFRGLQQRRSSLPVRQLRVHSREMP